jgi:trimeric autotransporter adhesin
VIKRRSILLAGGRRQIQYFDTLPVEAAYSVRKVMSAYSGVAIRVRRSSDNAEQDISFINNDLDVAALLSFCAGTDGFVVTWHDQSVNARNLTQATAANQPRIVTAGALTMTLNGRPGVVFDGTDDTMAAASWGTVAQPFTRNYVTTRRGNLTGHFMNNAGGSPNVADVSTTGSNILMSAGSSGPSISVALNETVIVSSIYNGANSFIRKNGTPTSAANVGAFSMSGIQVASFNGSSFFFSVDIYEVVVLLSQSQSSASLLERSQGKFYGLTVA